MPVYYSQHGEDCLLWQLFNSQPTPGYFVEVGALDGLRFSNTYSFEREGWTGVCVEAHPDYVDLLKQNRPGSRCVWAAAGDHEGEVVFYTNRRGSLSTLDPSLEEKFRRVHGKYFTGFEPKTVPMKTLNQILTEAHAPSPLDLVSIDVEGAEMVVLRGFDLDRFQPRVLVIEAMDASYEERLDEYLLAQGYHKARKLGPNVFFCRLALDVEMIAKAPLEDCTLSHVPHPLDVRTDSIRYKVIVWLRLLQTKTVRLMIIVGRKVVRLRN